MEWIYEKEDGTEEKTFVAMGAIINHFSYIDVTVRKITFLFRLQI